MEFPAQLADTLGITLDQSVIDDVLDLARDVAHTTERRFAPVTAFVVGAYAGTRVAAGASVRDAVTEARRAADELLAAGA